ncbi:class I SAM-dependent methyltransferase [Candidatus Woesearchaeota archaeon]|nr:class I SAM-dependent methyltransferase [Candidatus Woesearchaeota archaeon]
MARKTEHYYTEKPGIPYHEQEIAIQFQGKKFTFFTAAGTFSKDRLDKGTETLIQHCILKPAWEVLDLGCGYGVVGILLKHFHPNVQVSMSDINHRAVQLARKNAKRYGLETEIRQGNMLEPFAGKQFDTILLNPPQVAGKEICFQMIEQSKEYLKRGGLLQLVARHNKGGKTLAEKMQEVFGNVKEIAKSGGYRVYVSEKQ